MEGTGIWHRIWQSDDLLAHANSSLKVCENVEIWSPEFAAIPVDRAGDVWATDGRIHAEINDTEVSWPVGYRFPCPVLAS